MMVGMLLLAACGAPSDDERLLVLAASSLTDAAAELERGFEAAHPGVDVVVSTAGSQTLATQVRHGIAADVFASADPTHLEALADEGLAEAPRPFAENHLVLALRDGAPDVDLHRLPEVESLVVGDDDVPIGRYTASLLDNATTAYGPDWRAAVDARIVSREPNVRLVVGKLALGVADAALVYGTDVAAAQGVRAVALPDGMAPTATYVHAALTHSPNPDLARAWLAFVESDGQAVLASHGFGVASSPP